MTIGATEVESKHLKYLEGARQRLEESALQYARMKTMGMYLESGRHVIVSANDRQMYEDNFASELHRLAVQLLAELASAPLPARKPAEPSATD